jgi:hypothetical protein
VYVYVVLKYYFICIVFNGYSVLFPFKLRSLISDASCSTFLSLLDLVEFTEVLCFETYDFFCALKSL